MKKSLVPIDGAGRVVLPKRVRQELAIKPGDLFKVSIRGTAVTLTPANETSGFVRKGKALVFSTAGEQMLTASDVAGILNDIREGSLHNTERFLAERQRQQ